MTNASEAARKANATRKALRLNLTTQEARKLSPQMKGLIKALASMGINYHSSSDGEWAVVDEGSSRTLTVFTTGHEYIDFHFDNNGDFDNVSVGETLDGDEEMCPSRGNPKLDTLTPVNG